MAGQGCHNGQVFGLDEGDVPVATLPAVMIAQKALRRRHHYRIDNLDRRESLGSDADPLHPAGSWKYVEKVFDVLHRSNEVSQPLADTQTSRDLFCCQQKTKPGLAGIRLLRAQTYSMY